MRFLITAVLLTFLIACDTSTPTSKTTSGTATETAAAEEAPGLPMGFPAAQASIRAASMLADVTILEVDLERMRYLDISLHSAHTLYSSETHLMELLPKVDLLIGAVLVPCWCRVPKLPSSSAVKCCAA